jgi:predicted dehydrogenase
VEVPRYRVAIAGCHRMLDRRLVGHNWASGFAAVPRAEIVGVFDKGAATRQAFVDCWGPLPAFEDFGAMLDATRPDIVCVTTRQTMHAEQIEQAAAFGVRGILCEKPLATSLGEVERIVAACERHNVSFAFGLDRRWYPFYRTLAQSLRDGLIGEMRTITSFGLLNLINHGCHWFDRVLDLAGDPEIDWVAGEVDSLADLPADSPRHLDPPGTCQIAFANGIRAFVSPAGPGMGFDLVGSAGRLVLLHDGVETHLWSFGEAGTAPVKRDLAFAPPPPAWPLAVEDLINAIERGTPTIADIHVARRATEIGFAVHQSHREGGRRTAPAEIDRDLRIASFPWGNE